MKVKQLVSNDGTVTGVSAFRTVNIGGAQGLFLLVWIGFIGKTAAR
jgi:hypothetical protein